MSNIVEKAADAPIAAAKKVTGWAKAAPVIFTLLLIVVVIAAIRWRDRVAAFLAKIPGVRTLAGLSAPSKQAAPDAPVGG